MLSIFSSTQRLLDFLCIRKQWAILERPGESHDFFFKSHLISWILHRLTEFALWLAKERVALLSRQKTLVLRNLAITKPRLSLVRESLRNIVRVTLFGYPKLQQADFYILPVMIGIAGASSMPCITSIPMAKSLRPF